MQRLLSRCVGVFAIVLPPHGRWFPAGSQWTRGRTGSRRSPGKGARLARTVWLEASKQERARRGSGLLGSNPVEGSKEGSQRERGRQRGHVHAGSNTLCTVLLNDQGFFRHVPRLMPTSLRPDLIGT